MRPPSTLQLAVATCLGGALALLLGWVATPAVVVDSGQDRPRRLMLAADERYGAADCRGAIALLQECVRLEGAQGACAAQLSTVRGGRCGRPASGWRHGSMVNAYDDL